MSAYSLSFEPFQLHSLIKHKFPLEFEVDRYFLVNQNGKMELCTAASSASHHACSETSVPIIRQVKSSAQWC